MTKRLVRLSQPKIGYKKVIVMNTNNHNQETNKVVTTKGIKEGLDDDEC
jgi:hypothetical protein